MNLPHTQIQNTPTIFFMLTLLRRTSFDHLLLSLFQSSLHILQITIFHMLDVYQPYARVPNIYWNYIFIFKFELINNLFSIKNYLPCQDLKVGPPESIELSRLGSPTKYEQMFGLQLQNNGLHC